MSKDARFEEGVEKPLRLRAETAEDLNVISALVQDAIFTGADLRWSSRHRRVDLLLNRFRWEDAEAAKRENRAFERARSILTLQDVTRIGSQSLRPGDQDLVLSLLALEFTPGADGTGVLQLVLSGDDSLRLELECINVTLSDVTRPYQAPSGRQPGHDLA